VNGEIEAEPDALGALRQKGDQALLTLEMSKLAKLTPEEALRE
jgi:hypothetical protein